MKRLGKIFAGLGIAATVVLALCVVFILSFKSGDTFHPASKKRLALRFSKRMVAELAGTAVAIWDPFKGNRISACLGPDEKNNQAKRPFVSQVYESAAELQDYFNSSHRFSSMQVTVFDNGTLPQSSFPFYYQSAQEPYLDSLRSLYRLSELVETDSGDWARFRKLNCWIHKKFDTGQSRRSLVPKVDYNFNALDIIYRAGQGERFWCSEYSTSLVQCLAALGYTSRYLMLGSGVEGHVLCEVWCETFGKWIMLDPYYSRTVSLDSVPLNVYEIHRLLSEPGDITRAVICQDRENPDPKPGREAYFGLFRNFAVRMRNDWFSNRYPHWHPLSNSVMNTVEWQDNLTDDSIHYKNESGRLEDIYWPLNRVQLEVQPAGEGAELLIILDTFTPNFSHFLVKTGQTRADKIIKNSFAWKLAHGPNRLTVASVNEWGIQGRPVTLEILWKTD